LKILHFLDLALHGVLEHENGAALDGLPQGDDVEGGGEQISEPEEEHGGDVTLGVLQCEAGIGHTVLLGDVAGEVVLVTDAVDLLSKAIGGGGPLLAVDNSEVVIGDEAAGVALSSGGGAEKDEVLGERGMEDGHGSHGTTSIVEDPLTAVLSVLRVGSKDSIDDGHDDLLLSSVGTSLGDTSLGDLLEVLLVEDEVLLVIDDDLEADGNAGDHQQGKETLEGEDAAATHY